MTTPPLDETPAENPSPAPPTRATKSARRWVQISVRGVLLLMIAICLWLGVAVPRARDQAKRVEAVLKTGGYVFYDYELDPASTNVPLLHVRFQGEPAVSPWPAWLVQGWGRDFFHQVKGVTLNGDGVTLNGEGVTLNGEWISDDVVAQALGIRGLERLELGSYPIFFTGGPFRGESLSPKAFAGLDEAKSITHITVTLMTLGEESYKQIAAVPTLTFLSLTEADLNDAGLRLLEAAPNLRELHLHETDVTKAGLEHFRAARPQCVVQFSDNFYLRVMM
ncbi:MAG TPA: hypothetical protein VGE52_03865 [Pirellulales bacterium]